MEITVAPPHSIIFINDPTVDVVVPKDIGPGLVWATESCVAVGTLSEIDGLTTIQLASDFLSPTDQINALRDAHGDGYQLMSTMGRKLPLDR